MEFLVAYFFFVWYIFLISFHHISTVTVGGVGWSIVCLFFGTAPSLTPRLYHCRRTDVLTIAPAAPQTPYDHCYRHHNTCRRCLIIDSPVNPPLKYFRHGSIAVSVAATAALSLSPHHCPHHCAHRAATALQPPLMLHHNLHTTDNAALQLP